MDADLQRRVQRYGWDKAADYYERFWQRQLEPAQSLLLTMSDPRPGERILDIACGTGLLTFRAAAMVGANGAVLGTDISDKMVEIGRARAAERGDAHVTFARMDAEAMTIPDASFDAALCGLGLMYVPDPLAALREMFRAVRPGGRAAAAVWGARANCGWAEIFPIVDSRVQSDVCPMFFQTGTGDVLKGVFERAGFASVRAERIRTLLHYDSDEEAIGAAFIGGPVALAYSRFDEATRGEAHREYLRSIAPFAAGGGYDVPGEFVVAAGLRP
jgi:ubiquinone/menaquinone biosynthesis C-methylase UbiE